MFTRPGKTSEYFHGFPNLPEARKMEIEPNFHGATPQSSFILIDFNMMFHYKNHPAIGDSFPLMETPMYRWMFH